LLNFAQILAKFAPKNLLGGCGCMPCIPSSNVNVNVNKLDDEDSDFDVSHVRGV